MQQESLAIQISSEQLDIVKAFMNRHDVFAMLPTDYGKSQCYGCLPIILDKLLGSARSIIVVVTPLTAIMKDQVTKSLSQPTQYLFVTSHS